jgi:hypothetical protein
VSRLTVTVILVMWLTKAGPTFVRCLDICISSFLSDVCYLLVVGVEGYCCTWSHSDTPHSVGLLWTRDQPVVETSTWQHTTLTTDRHPCPRRNSNPQSQQANGRRPTP